jgi:hypothetical protein
MVEYGGAVRQSGDMVGGGGGSFDAVDQVMGALSDLADRVASLPPEMILLIAAILFIGGLIFFRRPG